MEPEKLYVVGVGAEGRESLLPSALRLVERADILIGARRVLETLSSECTERLAYEDGMGAVFERIEAELGRRRIVALASGDPGFFGLAKALAKRFGRDSIEVVPNVSSVQIAFARLKESWDDALLLSVHGRSLEGIAEAVSGSSKVAILTGGKNDAAAVARELISAGVAGYRAFLCEDLGLPGERVREMSLADLCGSSHSELNVLVLLKAGAQGEGGETSTQRRWPLGIPDEEFQQRHPKKGLITKLEVRMASLGCLGLTRTSTVWDVGAGSGSVAIEAASLADHGKVWAIERDPEGVALIKENVARFGASNVEVVHGAAPDALEGLPSPDAVFVGGSGGRLQSILDMVAARLSTEGRVVVNAATLETATAALSLLRTLGFSVGLSVVQVSRGKDLAGMTHLEALNPVFIVSGKRSVVAVNGGRVDPN